LVHEEQKHVKRVSRLERIRDLAAGKGDTKAVERVNKLMEKEQNRYGRKRQRMEEKAEE